VVTESRRVSEWWWLLFAVVGPAIVLLVHLGFFHWLGREIPIALEPRRVLRGQIILFGVAGSLIAVVVLGVVNTHGRARVVYLIVSLVASTAALIWATPLLLAGQG
jgi:hypothetical protein